MKGYYIFKENGVEVGRSENILTTSGKLLIANSMCANGSQWAGSIAVGALGDFSSGGATASASDIGLGFEFTRGPVQSLSPFPYTTPYSGGPIKLIAKAVLDPSVSGKIYETGLFSRNSVNAELIDPITFSSSAEGWTYRSATGPDAWTDLTSVSNAFSTGGRAGDNQINFSYVPSVGTKKIRLDIELDLSIAASSDKFAFACSTTGGTGSPGVTIRFYTDESNYFSYSLPSIATSYSGYRVLSNAKSSWTSTGLPSWSGISIIEIENSGSLVTHFDALRVIKQFADTDSILVSHSVFSSANSITKTEGTPLEIEYYLDVFN
jgi:hypothetical protein